MVNFKMIGKKGFTLIELMVVVAIIGILSAIAVPNFITFLCKAKQIEAKKNLSILRSCEEAYRAVHDTYGSDLNKLGFSFSGTSKYTYTFISAINASEFKAHTKGVINGKDDIWTIDQNGTLDNISNACK